MRAALSTRGPLAVLVALALALVAAMVFNSTTAQAQPGPKRAYCHSTQSATNPYVLVIVQAGGPADVAHESHLAGGSQERTPPDIFLGEGLTRDQAEAAFAEQCAGGETTGTTTTTGTGTTTTTGTGTTTTGTGTTTTGTGTTTTGTGTTTTGKETPIVVTKPGKKETVVVTKPGKKKTVVVATATASATASAKAAPVVQYQYSASASASPSPSASASASASPSASVLPDTGGSMLLPIGALVLLLGGGTAAFFAVRKGVTG